VAGLLALAVALVVGALSLPPQVPIWVRDALLIAAGLTVLLLLKGALDQWDFLKWRPRAVRNIILFFAAVMVIVAPRIHGSWSSWYKLPSPPELRFYCGDSEIKVDKKIELRVPWIPKSPIGPPNIWVVNVGGSDATDIHGLSFVSERFNGLGWNPGDEAYPRVAGWQINTLHIKEPQPIGTFSASRDKPIDTFRMRLAAHYNGPTTVAEFTVRLVPIRGPNYPESSLPCARPSFPQPPSSAPG
jgi:hypothetical protein